MVVVVVVVIALWLLGGWGIWAVDKLGVPILVSVTLTTHPRHAAYARGETTAISGVSRHLLPELFDLAFNLDRLTPGSLSCFLPSSFGGAQLLRVHLEGALLSLLWWYRGRFHAKLFGRHVCAPSISGSGSPQLGLLRRTKWSRLNFPLLAVAKLWLGCNSQEFARCVRDLVLWCGSVELRRYRLHLGCL